MEMATDKATAAKTKTLLTFIVGCAVTAKDILVLILGPVTIRHIRWFGATMILATLVLFNTSPYMSSSFEDVYKILGNLYVLFMGLALFPFPRNLNLKQRLELQRNKWCDSIPYDALRGFGSVLCYYLFNFLGSCVQIEKDTNLMCSTISFYFVLIVIDLLYDIEEALPMCVGYIFAGYGLMIKQTIVSQWFIHPTCLFFCLLKFYMRSNRELILTMIENRGENLDATLPTRLANVAASKPTANVSASKPTANVGSELTANVTASAAGTGPSNTANTVPSSSAAATVPSTSAVVKDMKRQRSVNTRISSCDDALYY